MMILALILPIIVYLGGGWIAKDIYFSLFPVTGNMTIAHINHVIVTIYAVVATAYCFIWSCTMGKTSDRKTELVVFFSYLPIIMAAIYSQMPTSLGLDILNTIVCIMSIYVVGVIAADS